METAKKCICKGVQVGSIRSTLVLSQIYKFDSIKNKILCNITVWHPRCGPCPSAELGGVLNGGASVLVGHAANGNTNDTDCDRLSNSAMSEMQVSCTCGRIAVINSDFT